MNVGIVMAGGAGKRMWPLSREKKPKQVLSLFMEKPFIQKAVDRLSLCTDKVVVSCGVDIYPVLRDLLPDMDYIVEPERRDTAPSIALSSFGFNDEDILVFTPSDAFIDSDLKFKETINQAILVAKKTNTIVLIGIKPTTPSTGFGYLQTDEVSKVLRFCEKPSKDLAENYVKEGYLWNSGMFICNAKVMKELFREHAPDIYEIITKIKTSGNLDELYSTMRKISFDFAVMEKVKDVSFVPASFYWNDIGSFAAISEVVKEKNVVLQGKLIEENSNSNIVQTDKNKTIALIDCDDLVVIDTPDALLICPKKSSEKVKKLVDEKVSSELK